MMWKYAGIRLGVEMISSSIAALISATDSTVPSSAKS
jgi:hypothetical protein